VIKPILARIDGPTISIRAVNTRSESAELAAAMRARAADWAAGAAEAKEFDRRRAAEMTVDERLAEGVRLTRIAERLLASVRPRRPS
jgi:hypothetical protein